MPRYFFHVRDGENKIDNEGTELAGWRDAQYEALMLAGTIIRDHARLIRLGEDWSMEVTDEAGLILFRLDFQIAASAAVPQDAN